MADICVPCFFGSVGMVGSASLHPPYRYQWVPLRFTHPTDISWNGGFRFASPTLQISVGNGGFRFASPTLQISGTPADLRGFKNLGGLLKSRSVKIYNT